MSEEKKLNENKELDDAALDAVSGGGCAPEAMAHSPFEAAEQVKNFIPEAMNHSPFEATEQAKNFIKDMYGVNEYQGQQP